MAPEWVVFARLLTEHSRRAEQLAYPEIERALTDGECRALLAMLQALGLDAVIHSGTKYLNGHSDLNAGVVVASAAIVERTREYAVNHGGMLDAHACFLLERGMKVPAAAESIHQ
jgi:hypothetical protein